MQKIQLCRGCQSLKLSILWSFVNSPYGDLFKDSKEAALSSELNSMTLAICNDCTLVQITEITNLELQYNGWLYTSQITNGLVDFYSQVAKRLVSDFSLKDNQFIVDIGMGHSDGSFLRYFKDRGFQVLGIEPTEVCYTAAQALGVNTWNSYFDSKIVDKILEQYKKPKLISINNTLANIPDVKSFINLVTKLMDNETIVSIITGYHPDQFSINMFDYVGHDHLSYFSVQSMHELCNRNNLKILDVSRIEHRGGSIQFLLSLKDSIQIVHSSVFQMLQREKWMNVYDTKFYESLKFRVERAITEVKEILSEQTFKELNGVGASMSTTYFCNQFMISNKIAALYDDDKNKIGKFSPGSGLRVLPLSTLPSGKDYLTIILAWQHTYKLLSRIQDIDFKGRVLIPLPEPKLINFV